MTGGADHIFFSIVGFALSVCLTMKVVIEVSSNQVPQPRIVRVLSNNAVVVTGSAGLDDTTQQVLVGRGIGFGAKVGQPVEEVRDHQKYVQLGKEQAQFLETLRSLDPELVEKCSDAVDLAADILGTLHPSVYIMLVEHLSFAVGRLRRGEHITNAIAGEIRAVFPEEFHAAEVVIQYINNSISDVQFPKAEAGFVALHLNAARTGVSVKAPLAQANKLAELVGFARSSLGIGGTGAAVGASTSENVVHNDGLESTIARLTSRLMAGRFRPMAAAAAIAGQLHNEFQISGQIICRILGCETMPPEATGEAAYLAVFLHGCVHDGMGRTPDKRKD